MHDGKSVCRIAGRASQQHNDGSGDERVPPEFPPFLVARFKRPAGTLNHEDLTACRQSTLEAVEPFLGEKPDLVVYACTAAGFLGGPSGSASMADALRNRTGASVFSTTAWP